MWITIEIKNGTSQSSLQPKSKNYSTDGGITIIIRPTSSESNSYSPVPKQKSSSKPLSPEQPYRRYEETYWHSPDKSRSSYTQNWDAKNSDAYWATRWDQLINRAKDLGIKE